MSIDMEKFGVSKTDIENAALGDFDDYVPEKKSSENTKVIDPITKNNDQPSESKTKTKFGEKASKTKSKDVVTSKNESEDTSASEKTKIDYSTGFFSNLYIVSFVRNLFTKQKAGICIWLVINMLLVMLPLSLPSAFAGDVESAIIGAVFGLAIYIVSLILALSPIGESILRWQNKCKKIKNQEIMNRIKPLFDEVYDQARTKDHSISDKVSLFMSPDDSPNAFATGRKTVCVTEGLFALSDEDIKAVLAHEFGHLSHKDTDVILAVTVGNMFFSGFMIFINVFINICMIIANFFINIFSRNKSYDTISKILYKAINFIFYIIMFLWTKLGVLICMHSNRKGEFAADQFAVDLGYCEGLSNALLTIDNGGFAAPQGLWASLHSSHPETADRISEMNMYNAQQTSR